MPKRPESADGFIFEADRNRTVETRQPLSAFDFAHAP
jgi:hypothetical protein